MESASCLGLSSDSLGTVSRNRATQLVLTATWKDAGVELSLRSISQLELFTGDKRAMKGNSVLNITNIVRRILFDRRKTEFSMVEAAPAEPVTQRPVNEERPANDASGRKFSPIARI